MKKLFVALLCVLCVLRCAYADEKQISPSDKRIEQGLKIWFEGNDEEAEKIFSALLSENSENPIPYHALAILLNDRQTEYPRITELFNRHRVLELDHLAEYQKIVPLLDEYVLKGCVQAQLMRARTLSWGLGGTPIQAMLLLRRAADGGYSQAQQELGLIYEAGTLVVKNIREAVRLYSASAAQNNAFAMKCLAVLYLTDKNSTTAQRKDAVALLNRAVESNLPEAQTVLAQMYRQGIAVKKDTAKALSLYERAAKNGHTDAMLMLALSYEHGKDVKKSSSDSAKWYKMAADRANASALFRLGVMYYTGEGVEEDHAEAFRYFKQAAERGQTAAWYNVAWLSLSGDGTSKKPDEAKKWFERSAMTGNADAQFNLGVMYANGNGVGVSLEEAFFWFELARLSGSTKAGEYVQRLKNELDAAALDRATRRAQTALKKIGRTHMINDE